MDFINLYFYRINELKTKIKTLNCVIELIKSNIKKDLNLEIYTENDENQFLYFNELFQAIK